jgi:predicted  nucleic acid-binding Zn-ribbon protein
MAKADKPGKLEREAEKIPAKVASSYERLAAKFRKKAQRAGDRLKDAKDEGKRAVYRQRFEIYGDVTADLEERMRLLRNGLDKERD